MTAIVSDHRGLQKVEESTSLVIGQFYRRKKLVKDDPAANFVKLVGTDWAVDEGVPVELSHMVYVVQSIEFGAIGKDWDGEFSVTFEPEDFEAEYELMPAAAVRLEAKRQHLDSIQATKDFVKAEADRRRQYS